MSKKVLMIEDDPDLGVLYTQILKNIGCQLEICADGQAALNKLAIEFPDLVIMDLTLKDISLEDFYSQYVEIPGISKVPLFLVSGRDDISSWGDLFGATRTLKKPVDMLVLKTSVQKALVEAPAL